ncbi:CBS domain-containing protein [Loktanella sp. M215]|uniref:CBS domain-containing protein n=1 Tax=Loktanella sp. M215 TaxID=2675431 RepID=UPI001F31D76A|nr:CBS domain-containing protein [Loktanella sp. M215]MCF7701624.1 CBS domain-containing protein [Loktanella sp. M215]
MLVEGLLQTASERLVTIREDARLIEAAKLLSAQTDLVVVCDGDGILRGVVTKTDVVRQISTCQGATCMCPVSTVMTGDVASCRGADQLKSVSELMQQRHLKNIPAVDADNPPVGVLTAQIILRALLGDAEYEEAQMIDFVKGIGYR